MFTRVKGESPESLIFNGLISAADLDLQQDKELQEWIYQAALHPTQSGQCGSASSQQLQTD